MALVRDEYSLKLVGQERSRETWQSRAIIEGRKEGRDGIRKKMITRKRECSARVERSRADDCGGVVRVRSKGS